MSKLLIHEPPLQVLPTLAKEIGLSEAIVLQQLHYLSQHERSGWVEKTLKEWQAQHFIFWHVGTVKRAFTSLRERQLVLHEQPNGPDRTARYRVDYEALDALAEGNKMLSSKGTQSTTARAQSAPVRNRKRATTDPPQPPKGERQRDLVAFNGDCADYAAEHFSDLDEGAEAVSQAVRAGATTIEAVTAHVNRWWRDGSEG